MMTMQKKTHGQQFLEVLSAAKDDKTKMFTLLQATLEKINPFPTEKVDFPNIVSRVTEMESIAAVKAAQAGVNASHGAYMFSEDYIYLTAKAYKEQGFGPIANFKQDFKEFVEQGEVIAPKQMEFTTSMAIFEERSGMVI